MRVLHVMEATIGGTRRHIVDVAAGQQAAGLDVHVIVAAEREPAFRQDLEGLRANGVEVCELPMVRAIRPGLDAAHYAAIVRSLKRLRPDVLHTHSSKAGFLGRLASLATDIGLRVHTPHTFAFLFEAMFGPLKRRLFRAIEQNLSGWTQAVVAVSNSEAETFVRAGVVERERIHLVANGIDPRPWLTASPLARESLGVAPGVCLAAVVGLLNVAKGQDLALEALASCADESAELAIVGHGPERAALEREASARGLAERVHFLGWRDDVPSILAACDVLLLPSRWEGMPYIVLEAMAAGLPVVSHPVDGALDLIVPGRTGLLSASSAPGELGLALEAFLELEPERRRELGQRGRERVLASHTREHMIAALVALYESLA